MLLIGRRSLFSVSDFSDRLLFLRVLKTELHEEFLMKRFGGITFFQSNTVNSFDVLSETLINQIVGLVNRTNPSLSTVNAAKVAALFRINPAQATVSVHQIRGKLIFKILF